MIELLKLKYFYFIIFIFCALYALSSNKIKADQEIRIIADKIEVNETDQVVNASGNVIAISENGTKIKSDRIIYSEINSKIDAEGNIVLNDTDGNTFFFDTLTTNSQASNLQGVSVRGRLDDNSRIVGESLVKKEDLTTLTEAEFTPCLEQNYLIKECPGWKLKANKIYQDNTSKTIHYDHATIHLFNIPVLYLPYFSHPDPSVNKRSGFLMPTVETDDNLGDKFSIPIFYNISGNQDITLTPNIQSNSNNYYGLNYRYLDKSGRYNIDASIDDNDDKSGTSNHLFFDADLYNNYGDLNIFLKSTNNDTYMRKNKINRLTVLDSGFRFDRNDKNTFLTIENNNYKHLTVQDSEQWEYVYPKISYVINDLKNDYITGNISLNNNLLLKRDLNEDQTSLISSQIDLRRNNIDVKSGLVFNHEGNFRVVSVSIDKKIEKDIENIRFYPQWSSKISYPLIRETNNTTQTISLIVNPIIAPYNNYTDKKNITNSNIFSVNRASSVTEWESGPRVNYGLEWFFDFNNITNINLALGQNYSLNKNSNDTEEELSDYFLSSSVSIGEKNYLNNSFVIDRRDIDVKSINLNTFAELEKFKFAMDYDYTSGKYSTSKEQVGIGGEYNFAKDFYLKFTGSKNLDTNKNIGYQYGLLYENDCLGIDFNFFRDLTVDRDISESDGFSFTIVLKPFGSTKNYGNKKVFGPSIND